MKKQRDNATVICGDYQYKALTEGNPVQRFWHYSKKLAIQHYMPPDPSDFVLDVGCGSGVVAEFLGTFGATVMGIDSNDDAIKFARARFARSNVHFMHGQFGAGMNIHTPVDKIYCLEVIEHMYFSQAEDMLKIFFSLLKPGGRVFLTTPNYRSLWPLIEYGMDLFGRTPKLRGEQHVEFYYGKKLERLSRQAGFRIELMKTLCLVSPWTAALSWELALKMFARELKLPFHWGPIIMCIMIKDTAHS